YPIDCHAAPGCYAGRAPISSFVVQGPKGDQQTGSEHTTFLILHTVNQTIRCHSSNSSLHQQSGSCPANAQIGKWVEGAIGMVWNPLAVNLATRRSSFLCSQLAVPLRIVPRSRRTRNSPH